jgi:hypothetical protein
LTELVLGISRSKAAAAAPATALRTWNCMPGESPAGDGDGMRWLDMAGWSSHVFHNFGHQFSESSGGFKRI